MKRNQEETIKSCSKRIKRKYMKRYKSWEEKLPRYDALFEPIRNWVIFGLGKDIEGPLWVNTILVLGYFFS